jgi:hypothetical protein
MSNPFEPIKGGNHGRQKSKEQGKEKEKTGQANARESSDRHFRDHEEIGVESAHSITPGKRSSLNFFQAAPGAVRVFRCPTPILNRKKSDTRLDRHT